MKRLKAVADRLPCVAVKLDLKRPSWPDLSGHGCRSFIRAGVGGFPITKHGGTITLYVLSSPIGVWRYRGEEELLGWFWNDQSPPLIGIISTSPNFFCDSSDPTTTPRKFRETLIRNGTDHVLTYGGTFTRRYIVPIVLTRAWPCSIVTKGGVPSTQPPGLLLKESQNTRITTTT